MGRWLVIGCGNPLRTDDGLGLRVAEALDDLLTDGQCEIIATHQLTPELCEKIALAEKVAFVDVSAKSRGQKAGQIEQHPVQGEIVQSGAFTHQVSPLSLVGLAGRLYGRQPEAVLFTVEAASFELGEGLTPPVQAAMPDLINRIRDWLG